MLTDTKKNALEYKDWNTQTEQQRLKRKDWNVNIETHKPEYKGGHTKNKTESLTADCSGQTGKQSHKDWYKQT